MKRLRMILTLVVLGATAAFAIGCEADSSEKSRNNSVYVYLPNGDKIAEYHGDVEMVTYRSSVEVYADGKKLTYQNAVVVFEEDE